MRFSENHEMIGAQTIRREPDVEIQPFTIDSEDEAKAYLTDLLADPRYQSMSVVEARCAKMVRDPAIREFFRISGRMG